MTISMMIETAQVILQIVGTVMLGISSLLWVKAGQLTIPENIVRSRVLTDKQEQAAPATQAQMAELADYLRKSGLLNSWAAVASAWGVAVPILGSIILDQLQKLLP